MALSRIDKFLIAATILELPLQLDTYLMYHEVDAEQYGAVGGLILSLTTLCLAAMYAVWLVEAALRLRPRRDLRVPGFAVWVYFGAVCASTIVASNRLFSLFELAVLIQAILLFVFVVNRVRERGDLLFVLTVMGVSTALQGVIVMVCSLTGRPAIGETIDISIIHIESWMDGRPCGTLSTPNAVGSFLATLIVPVSSLLLVPSSRVQKLVAAAAVGIGSLAVVMTRSRASILALAIAFVILGVLVLWRGWLPRWIPVLALLVAAVTAFAVRDVYLQRVAEGDKGSAESRIHLARVSSEVIEAYPLLGVGAGNYHLGAQPYADSSPYRSEWFYTVHSRYLLIWAETGLVGLLGFLGIVISALSRGWQGWLAADWSTSPIALALAAGLTGHLVHMLVDVFNSRPAVQMLWLCFSLLVCVGPLCMKGSPASPAAVTRLPQRPFVPEPCPV